MPSTAGIARHPVASDATAQNSAGSTRSNFGEVDDRPAQLVQERLLDRFLVA